MNDQVQSNPNTCETCPYWRHQAGQAVNVATSALAAGHAQVESGLCVYGRPAMMMLPAHNPLTRQMEPIIQRQYPVMLANEFCADHPVRAAAREYALAQARERALRDMVEYAPDKHGDAHAGFSAPPSLEQAKRLAVVAKQCPAEGPLASGNDVYVQCKLPAGHECDHVY